MQREGSPVTTPHMLYLDNNATTRPDPAVVAAMLPYYETQWGNPSSLHRFGREVRQAVDRAREAVAALVGARRASELIFTSSGTEANNTAIRGICAAQPGRRHLVTTQVEHSSVLQCCRALEQEGYEVSYCAVDREGRLSVEALQAAIRPDTALVTTMWANNETGVCFPIGEIAALCAQRGVICHTDAVQVAGKLPLHVESVGVASLSISAHKFHGPKGSGALYLRRGTPFRPCLVGGGQEYGRRSGTENVPQIVGMGVAAELAAAAAQEQATGIAQLRDQLEQGLLEAMPHSLVNGAAAPRVPNTTNMSFTQVDGEGLILALSDAGLAASTGSACSQGATEPSHVLRAMHLSPEHLRGTLRLSLCRETTAAMIVEALTIITQVVRAQRAR